MQFPKHSIISFFLSSFLNTGSGDALNDLRNIRPKLKVLMNRSSWRNCPNDEPGGIFSLSLPLSLPLFSSLSLFLTFSLPLSLLLY